MEQGAPPLERLTDPVEQWLLWEEQANLVGFRTSTAPVEVSLTRVPREALEIYVPRGAPPEIVGRFLEDTSVLFARHPLNRDPTVAWSDAPEACRWSCRFTSSRTLAVVPAAGAPLFSLKLATDHPHPAFHQPEKTRLREEALDALGHVALIDRVDALLGPPRDLALVTEVLVVLARGGESGFLVRDLRLFQDGHHYLPVLSLPFVGRAIAAAHGLSFDRFWGRHYAEAVGRAKARLLVHYGLFYETPNPQNVLLQLDAGLRPTGRVVLRDVGDADPATDAPGCRDVPWTRLLLDLRPETANSFWAFGEAGEQAVDTATLERWYALHDRAYFGELADAFPDAAPRSDLPPADALAHWNGILRSDSGTRAIAAAFARMQQQQQQALRSSARSEA